MVRRLPILLLAALLTTVAAERARGAGEILQARDAVEAARAAGAKDKTPFEYYAAKAYLELAEFGERAGERELVRTWGRKSVRYAEEALARLREGAQ